MQDAATLEHWQHSHVFDEGNPLAERNTRWVVWLTAAMMVAEIAGGWVFNSMALLADGWHMSSHALALGLSVLAYAAARRYAHGFIRAYGEALYEALLQCAIPYEIRSPACQKLGAPIAVYNHEIVCFDLQSGTLAVGDTVVAETSDGLTPFRYGDILSLQIDRVDYPVLNITQPTKIAARVAFHANEQYTYYALPQGVISSPMSCRD